MKIAVIGAGVVGCATAYALLREGCEVHLFDKEEGPGLLTSKANGAQLSYAYVEPFATPQTLLSLPLMLLSPTSAVRWKPSLSWDAWKWQFAFLWACRPAQVVRGTQHLLNLASESREVLSRWALEEGWQFQHRVAGKLVLCGNDRVWAVQKKQVALQAEMGCHQQLLSPSACVEQEPTLTHYESNFVGGIWTPDEAVADPHLLCIEMVKSIQARGGHVHWSCEVDALPARRTNAGVTLKTSKNELFFDRVVLAAGPLGARWSAASGFSLPVQPIKGYSMTLDLKPGQTLPKCSVTDLSLKTVFAPLDGRLRVAAMAELVGHDLSLPAKRLAQMQASVEAIFPGMCDHADPKSWAGLRPATPDSLPIIGRSPRANVYLNVGQGGLGLTLAAGSAVRLVKALNL